jgi:hypothetical protein
MTRLLHYCSAICFILALVGIVALVVADTMNQLRLTSIHRQAGAFSFMLIGSSYISLLLGSRQRWKDIQKQVFLGIAFFLWGCEQFLPAGPWVTVVDTAVILIFVIDLSLIILERLRHRQS